MLLASIQVAKNAQKRKRVVARRQRENERRYDYEDKGCEKLQVERKIERLRVVTYNIHKCLGLNRRVRPARITEVLRELNADNQRLSHSAIFLLFSVPRKNLRYDNHILNLNCPNKW